MKRYLFYSSFLLLAAAICFFAACMPEPGHSSTAHRYADHAAMTSPPPDGALPLFPGLNAESVTAVTVSSDERSFEFHCSGEGNVLVNGSRADGEIFRTLVDQITEINVSPAASASPAPECGEPLLQLSVSAGGTQYHASFYQDDTNNALALVASGSHNARHRTEGWRVGTLMLTCEGARMDEEL